MASNIPQQQLPTPTVAWVDPATGLPTKEFALFMQSLGAVFQSINSAIGGGASTFLQKALNLSDVASAPTSRTNLGLTAAATTPLNVANGIPTLNASGQYQGFDGQLIANVQTYNVSQAPRVLTVIGAYYGGGGVGYGGTFAGTALGWVSYGLGFSGPYGSTPFLTSTFNFWGSMPGSWQNITVQTTNTGDFGVFVRFA